MEKPMYTKIVWEASYATNHPKIDKQHQGLFKLIDDIPDYLDAEMINECIMKLYDYTGIHFSDEERIMQSIGYPDLKNHQKLHYDLVSKLGDFGHHGIIDLTSLLEFKEFTKNWLVEHILQEDMKYKDFVDENNINW